MTFNPTDYFAWERRYPRFTDWAIKHDVLFFPKEITEEIGEEHVDLTSKIYILMKRLGQDYETIMRMDAEERDKFVELEVKLMENEKKKYDNLNPK